MIGIAILRHTSSGVSKSARLDVSISQQDTLKTTTKQPKRNLANTSKK